jgi:hypothetical protein
MEENIIYEKAIPYSVSLYPRHLDIINAVAVELAARDRRVPSVSRALQYIIDIYAEERVRDAVMQADG